MKMCCILCVSVTFASNGIRRQAAAGLRITLAQMLAPFPLFAKFPQFLEFP